MQVEHANDFEVLNPGTTEVAAKRVWIKPVIEDFQPVTIARGLVQGGTGDMFDNIS